MYLFRREKDFSFKEVKCKKVSKKVFFVVDLECNFIALLYKEKKLKLCGNVQQDPTLPFSKKNIRNTYKIRRSRDLVEDVE